MLSINIKENNVDFILYVGRNAVENWSIVDKATKEDMWFHLEDNPSCHVILKTNKCIVSKKLIYNCAIQCKKYSKFYKSNNISVIYTTIDNIIKGDKIGSVVTKKVKKILV